MNSRIRNVLFAAVVFALATADRTRAAEPRDLLGDLSDWVYVGSPATPLAELSRVGADGSIAFAGKPTGFIATTASHHDYRLHVEWRWPDKPGNGGILLHISSGPKDRAWPESFQVQTKHHFAGDLLPMAGTHFAEALTSEPGATAIKAHTGEDSEREAGEWNVCDIVCHGDAITVSVNGVLQNAVTGCSAGAGQIGFQFEGTPFELRNVSIEPLAR